MTAMAMTACTGQKAEKAEATQDNFNYVVDQFADLQILRYRVPGFESLSLKQKQLLYHLSEAALMGRDILFDQNCRYNLPIRRALEAVYTGYKGDRTDPQFVALETYLKRVWFANGIHHHYAEDKFVPGFTPEFFQTCISQVGASALPLREGQTVEQFVAEISPVIFDPAVMAKRTVQSGDVDLIRASANNYYGEGVTQVEVEDFYARMKAGKDTISPISYGLNSRLVKENGKLVEKVWKVGGLYSPAIEKIVSELQKATAFAENDAQKSIIGKLIEYYQTGDLKIFDAYSILWVEDTVSDVDFVNGFIETYGDPLGMKASWESTVNFINKEATKRTKVISDNAQWFEDHSPVDKRFKKEKVKGVSAKVITVSMLGGDCYPATPIGINLPNADWIRRDHGSKSVTIENITEAYDKASQGNGFNEEFVWSDKEREGLKKYGFITDNLHTDLHECLGHGSGKLLPDTDPDALKAYSSTLEEARADLFGLYYLGDAKLVELGLVPDMILGDYDSVEDGLLDKYKSIDIKTYPKEKDYTDTHIAIINALKAGASVIYILGATGTRMDHTFTNISNMKAALDSGVPCFICDSHNKIYLINDKMGEVKVSKKGQYGDYVSFVPLSEETIISLAGFKYVLDDYILHQGLSICQSNEIKENVAVINIKKGLVIVFETKD